MTTEEKVDRAVLTIHQSCERGGGEGQDKVGQCGHIIGPVWVSHLPADPFMQPTEFTKCIPN
jgi:hypothetical protein